MASVIAAVTGCTKQESLTDVSGPLHLETLLKRFDLSLDESLGAASFGTFAGYRNYLGATDAEKAIVQQALKDMGFKSLRNHTATIAQEKGRGIVASNQTESRPWYQNEDIQSFTSLLNEYGLIAMQNYLIKINAAGTYVYVAANSSRTDAKALQALLQGEPLAGKVFAYTTQDDVTYMLEEQGLGQQGITQNSIFCWGRSGARGDSWEPAVYFLDATWPASTISFVANEQYGLPTSNSRVSVKMEYLKLGVFFQLVLKGKYDREDGSIGINGDNVFTGSTPWGVGEGRWYIVFTEKHQGKCKKDNEVFNSGTLAPPLNNENKTRRVFWESDNGLHKYQIQSTLYLWCHRAWRGLETEMRHYVEPSQFFAISNYRMVASTEIYNHDVFTFKDNY